MSGLVVAALFAVAMSSLDSGINSVSTVLTIDVFDRLNLSAKCHSRLRLAQALAVAERRPEPWSVLLADEFGSTLDRTTASVIAGSVRRWVRRSRVCFVAATAHDDLLEPLDPDVLVEVEPAGRCAVHHRSS